MKKNILKKSMQWIGLCALAAVLLTTVAIGADKKADTEIGANKDRKVQIGDNCAVEYSCRFKDGTLLVTTSKSIANDPKALKSDLFVELTEYKPVELLAGVDAVEADPAVANVLLPRLDKKLSEAIVGRAVGQWFEVELASEDMPPAKGDSEVRMKLVRVRPIERTYSLDLFKRLSQDKDPVIGMQVQLEPPGLKHGEPGGLMGQVSAIDAQGVKVKLLAQPGDTFQTPFGPAKVERYRDEKMAEIRVQPQIGKVLRFGNMLGRITKTDDTAFIIDMSNPFGGETLQCRAAVLDDNPDSPEKKALIDRVRADMEKTVDLQMAAAQSSAEGEKPDSVQSGDMAWVQYKITDEKGKSWFSLFPESTGAKSKKKKSAPAAQSAPGPYFPMVAGRESDVPGLDLAVLGMKKGERKQLSLPPAQGFGIRDEKQVIEFERTRQVAEQTTMERALFEKQYKINPVEGAQLDMPPYGRATILAVTDLEVTYVLKAQTERMEHPYGFTTVKTEKGQIIYTLTPVIGAAFSYESRSGIITQMDDQHFSVDFNHPLAGQTVTLTFVVHDFQKASALARNTIQWQEEFEKGRAAASAQGKPMALVLYADWCQWCKRFLEETLTDPVINTMANQFVWVKVNSDKEQQYKAMFGQNSFPMMVLLDKKGQVIEKHEGFQQVYPLYETMQNALKVKKS